MFLYNGDERDVDSNKREVSGDEGDVSGDEGDVSGDEGAGIGKVGCAAGLDDPSLRNGFRKRLRFDLLRRVSALRNTNSFTSSAYTVYEVRMLGCEEGSARVGILLRL